MILRVLFCMGVKLGLSHCGRKVGLVFENRALRWMCGPKRDEVTGKWRRLHYEEFYDLYCSPEIMWVIISTRIRSAGHVARMGDRRDNT